ncbi:MAG: DUF4375 domain-containing protein [Planctomycetes bacterium]|nr:DUF4375 domain-containing protein [Planctomycetota bacterium]MCB9920271.1 DUF4375 domain-containing protein [Planctomycetota bacterium]
MSKITSEVAFQRAVEMLHAKGDVIDALPKSVATYLRVHAAQGMIDNGGYPYFFGSNWPGTPPYEDFIASYRAIGCQEQATELERVVATFGFDEPHRHEVLRQRFIEEHYDKDAMAVVTWGNALCGDESVWQHLDAFAERHSEDFLDHDPDEQPDRHGARRVGPWILVAILGLTLVTLFALGNFSRIARWF